MRALLVLAVLLAMCLGPAGAAVVSCDSVPGGFVTSTNDVLFPYAVWTAPGFECEQMDNIYSNFSPGAAPTDTTLRVLLQVMGTFDIHTLVFGGSFPTDFTLGYTVTIDNALSGELIYRVAGDLQDPSNIGTPSNLKTVFGAGGFTGSLTSTLGSPGTPIAVPGLSTLNVTDALSAGNGLTTNVGNSFFEGVPEPATTVLFGAGLLALGLIRRFRKG